MHSSLPGFGAITYALKQSCDCKVKQYAFWAFVREWDRDFRISCQENVTMSQVGSNGRLELLWCALSMSHRQRESRWDSRKS